MYVSERFQRSREVLIKYSNLLLVCRKVQELLYIRNTDTFIVEMGKLNLDIKRSEKLLKLRSLAFVESC